MSDYRCSPELVALLNTLVAEPSFSGEERQVQQRIIDWFAERGIQARLEQADGGLQNVVVEIHGHQPGPTLWIGGHCDTVGIAKDWTRAPYQPHIEGNRLYGLGSMDMKAGLAAAMETAYRLSRMPEQWSGKVIFAALADEEAWSRGANAFVRTDRGIDAAIMCEPHFDDVVIGAMGKINLLVEVKGRAAHGSTPERGVNAVVEAAKLLVAIDQLERFSHPQFGQASHCVLNVTSGDGRYEISVPDRCSFRINWHFMPGETPDDALRLLNDAAAALDSEAEFVISLGEPRYESFMLGEQHPLVTAFVASYRQRLGNSPELRFGKGVSDANIFAGRAGIPTLLFGRGGANMHSGDEWVNLDQLEQAMTVCIDFALRFLNVTDQKVKL